MLGDSKKECMGVPLMRFQQGIDRRRPKSCVGAGACVVFYVPCPKNRSKFTAPRILFGDFLRGSYSFQKAVEKEKIGIHRDPLM